MIGQVVSHYRITAKLGEGGMGVVYRADDLKLDRQVAIKVLPPRLSQHPEARVRLLREAKAASALQHPNICSVFEIDDTEDGQLFMVMPCYEGETLRERLDRGLMPVDEALEIGRQLSSALAATHVKGIVHRDLKPGNVMLTNGGTQAVLMDFGLARPDGATQITRTGAAMGTIAYMSPEQVRGEHVEQRADLWALGVVLYEMTTGERPFKGDGEVPILESILHSDPDPASSVRPGVPPALAAMIDGLLEKSVEKREADAGAVSRMLEEHQHAIAEQGPGLDAPLGWRLRHWAHRHRGALRVTAAAVVVILALATWRLWPTGRPMINSLAVLPFTDLSGGEVEDWFCDGMTDELIRRLGEAGVPGVFSRTSMLRFKESNLSIPEISRELGADAVIEASILQLEGLVRVNVRLVRGETEEQLWSDSFEREMKDILRLHGEVAQNIVEQVRVAIDPAVQDRFEQQREIDPEAFRAYLRGRHWLTRARVNPPRDDVIFLRAKEWFDQAIALDPASAEGWVGLADWYIRAMHGEWTTEECAGPARAALSRAFEIDSDLSMAHTAAAHLAWEHEWDPQGAVEAYQRAFELNPSDSYAWAIYAYYCSARRLFEEGADAARNAIRLDPYNQLTFHVSFQPIFLAGHVEEALEVLKTAEERFSELRTSGEAARQRSWILSVQGRYEEALAALEEYPTERFLASRIKYLSRLGRIDEAKALDTEYSKPESGSECPSLWQAWIDTYTGEHTRAVSGVEATLSCLQQKGTLTDRTVWSAAQIYIEIGDLDRSFELMESLYANRFLWLTRINCLPWYYDPLHEDPRFHSLVRRMGLSS